MGTWVKRLRIIRDRFIAGHDCCELRLDSVSPETPIRDIVDRCLVWESHADSDTRRFRKSDRKSDRALPIYMVNESGCGVDERIVAAVTTSQTTPDQLETLLRCLLPGPVVPPPSPKPVPSSLEQLLQRLLAEGRLRSLPCRRRLGVLTSSPCCRACFPGLWPQRRERSRVPCDGTGLQWCASRVAKWTMPRPGVWI